MLSLWKCFVFHPFIGLNMIFLLSGHQWPLSWAIITFYNFDKFYLNKSFFGCNKMQLLGDTRMFITLLACCTTGWPNKIFCNGKVQVTLCEHLLYYPLGFLPFLVKWQPSLASINQFYFHCCKAIKLCLQHMAHFNIQLFKKIMH